MPTVMAEKRTQWTRRPSSMECPICNRQSWCTISTDGTLARCSRVESDRPAPSKGGEPAWVHTIDGSSHTLAVPLAPANTKPKMPQREVESLARKAYQHHRAVAMRVSLSEKLGLSVATLEALRVGWGVDEWSGQQWSSWPSRDSDGKIIGISRRYSDGVKKNVPGTTTGLYYPVGVKLFRRPVLIVEGATDVAAAMMMGWFAVGRFSNTGGAEIIRRMRLGSLLVVGEMDCEPKRRGEFGWCEKDCKGCARCFPGLFGAQTVAKALGCPFVMPPDGCKDLRQVVTQHRTGEFLDKIAGMRDQWQK